VDSFIFLELVSPLNGEALFFVQTKEKYPKENGPLPIKNA